MPSHTSCECTATSAKKHFNFLLTIERKYLLYLLLNT